MDNQIAKLADRPFVLGYFLPSLIFVLALAVTYPNFLPGVDLKAAPLQKWSSLASIALFGWFIAILLALFNLELMRILEGYYLPQPVADSLRKRQERRYEDMTARLRALNSKRPPSAADRLEIAKLSNAWLSSFPYDRHLLLPTRFGNVLRAFESYSGRVYRADAVILWPRLVSVISKDYMSLIGDGRARVNFFVNLTYLSLVFALVSVTFHCWPALTGATRTHFSLLQIIVIVTACVVLSVLSLKAATRQAVGWGHLVKSAYDIYLPELAKQLGYKLPETLERQRVFWLQISQQATYHRSLKPEDWERPTEAGKSKDGKSSTADAEGKAGDTAESEKKAIPPPPTPAAESPGDVVPIDEPPRATDA